MDGNGFITAKEIGSVMKALGEDIPGFRIRIIIEEADKDENGKIDFDEFLRVSVEFLSIFFLWQGGGIGIGTAGKNVSCYLLKGFSPDTGTPPPPLDALVIDDWLTDDILSFHC